MTRAQRRLIGEIERWGGRCGLQTLLESFRRATIYGAEDAKLIRYSEDFADVMGGYELVAPGKDGSQ